MPKRVEFQIDAADAGGGGVTHKKKFKYSRQDLLFLSHMRGSFIHKMYATLKQELGQCSHKVKINMLTACNNGAFRWAASNGDLTAMRFILEHTPDDARPKLIEALSYRHNVAIRDFIEHCVGADLSKPETQVLLNEGLQIFATINAGITVEAMRDIVQEYAEDVQPALLAAVEAITPHAEASHDDAPAPAPAEQPPAHSMVFAAAASGGPFFKPMGDDLFDSGGAAADPAPRDGSIWGGDLSGAMRDNDTDTHTA